MILAFGDFELDPQRGQLRRDRRPVDLARKPLELLCFLARQRGRTVSRDEILRDVWPEAIVSDTALSTAIRDLRRVLGDDGRRQLMVRTLRGRGVRFVAEVREISREAARGPALIGRHEHLAQLGDALDEAAKGQHRCVLITGDAGIGKTRLAREATGSAAERGFATLWGRSWEGASAPPFWPWPPILEEALGETSPGRLRERLGARAEWLSPLLPSLELGGRVGGSEVSRFRIFDAVHALLRSLGEARPLLVAVDDVQHADVASLDLLRFLAHHEGGAPLLLLGTWRDSEPAEDDPRTAVLASLVRGERVERLALEGLTRSQTGEVAAALVGHDPDPAFVAALHDKTRGNPFFIQETVRHLITGLPEDRRGERWTKGALVEEAGVAEGVREVVEQRAGSVSAPCRAVLDRACVAGSEIPVELLEDLPSLRDEPVLALADEAIAAHLLEEIPGRRGELRFPHPLVHEVLYDELGLARRRSLHAEVGDTLERISGGTSERPWAALAHHFEHAGPEYVARAFAFSELAGRHASDHHAWEDAATHLGRALRLEQRAGGSEPKRRCQLLLDLAMAQRLSGQPGEAAASAERAVALARVTDAPELLARAVEELESVRNVTSELPDDLSHIEEALEALGEQDLPLRARLLSRLAFIRQFDGEGSEQDARAALETARRTGDRELIGSMLMAMHWSLPRPDQLEERIAFTREFNETARSDMDRNGALEWECIERLQTGDLPGFRAAVLAGDGLADGAFGAHQAGYARLRHAQLDLLQGRFEAAEQTGGDVLAQASAAGLSNLASGAHGLFIGARYLQGRLAELLPALATLPRRALSWQDGAWRAAELLVRLEGGQEQSVRAAFQKLAREDFEPPVGHLEGVRLFLLSEICRRLDAPEVAPALEARLLPYLPQHLVGNGMVYSGSSHHAAGLLAATTGWHDVAIERFSDAIAAYEALDAAPWIARAWWEKARSVESRGAPGDEAAADELRCEASAEAGRLGMRLGDAG